MRRPHPPTWLTGPARLHRRELASTLAPEQVALLVRADERPFALVGAWAGGGALIGSAPAWTPEGDVDPFELLDLQPSCDPHAGAVGGGWFGWLGFGLAEELEPVGPSPPRPLPAPRFALAFYDHLLHLLDGRWWFEALWTPARAAALREREAILAARLAGPAPRPGPVAISGWRWQPGDPEHAAGVAHCRERIAAGDVFQVNLCRRLAGTLAGGALDVYVRGLSLAPEYAAFVGAPELEVASLSPELFLRRRGTDVLAAPIKGTRARSADPARAARQRAELVASAKDVAENVMIADVMRNDLGRVCRYGSVTVGALAAPVERAGVWHLETEVAGELAAAVTDGALVRAAYPPASVTGAPKVAAVRIIHELESTGREAYTGAVGYASPLAGLELNVAIRTFEVSGDRIWLGVGGGVVSDSSPAGEAAECAVKAAPLLAAIGSELPPPAEVPALDLDRLESDPRRGTPVLGPDSLRGIPRLGTYRRRRPDPALGLLETLLVVRGRPVELDGHLARLARSAADLYALAPPPDLREAALAAAAREPELARLRITAAPGRDALEVELGVEALAPELVAAEQPVALAPAIVPGGIGAHKWRDRRLLDALSGDLAGAVPVIVDVDGHALEAARANLFAVEGVRLVTPPADGRLLPGIARAAVLRLARGELEVVEEPLTVARLLAADELLLAGSLRGVEAVGSWDGAAVGGANRVTVRLRRRLREEWGVGFGPGPQRERSSTLPRRLEEAR